MLYTRHAQPLGNCEGARCLNRFLDDGWQLATISGAWAQHFGSLVTHLKTEWLRVTFFYEETEVMKRTVQTPIYNLTRKVGKAKLRRHASSLLVLFLALFMIHLWSRGVTAQTTTSTIE